jgi:hypothetical protein
VTVRRGRRGKELLDGLKKKRMYWKLKEGILDRTLWRRLRSCLKTDHKGNEIQRAIYSPHRT